MNEVNKWLKMCLKKKKLKEKWADDIISRSKTPLRKYHCPYCFSWHLTSKNVNIKENTKEDINGNRHKKSE